MINLRPTTTGEVPLPGIKVIAHLSVILGNNFYHRDSEAQRKKRKEIKSMQRQ